MLTTVGSFITEEYIMIIRVKFNIVVSKPQISVGNFVHITLNTGKHRRDMLYPKREFTLHLVSY